MRLGTVLARPAALLLAALALVLAAAAVLWVWSGSAGSLRWAWERFAVPQGLVAEGLDGSLRQGARAARLRWSRDGLAVRAHDVELAWNPWALLRERRLHLTRLAAGRVEVEDRRPPSPTPPQPPSALTLPLPVQVDDIRLGRLRWDGRTDFEAGPFAGAYRYQEQRHRLELREAVVAGGRYEGRAELGATAPLPLDLSLRGQARALLPGGRSQELALEATATGPLADLSVRARLRAPEGAAGRAPSADVEARVTPWQPQPLPALRARVQALDLALLWPAAPATDLSGRLDLAPADANGWTLEADLANARPAPWDRGGLPVARLKAEGQWRDGQALLRRLDAQAGGGRIEGGGQWTGAAAWTAELRLRGVRPGQLNSRLADAPADGRLRARGAGERIDFDADLASPGGTVVAGGLPALRSLQAEGRWDGGPGRLSLSRLDLRTDDARLAGALDAQPARRAGGGRLTLTAPGLRARAEGEISPDAGAGRAELDLLQAGPALAWLGRLPGVALPALEPLTGDGRIAVDWRGGWRSPTLSVQGRAALQQAGRRLRLDLAADGRRAGDAWRGQLARLRAQAFDPRLGPGDWSLQLAAPVDLRWNDGRAEVGAGRATLVAPVRRGPSQAALSWEPIRWGGGELRTAGRLAGLPASWLALVAPLPTTGDLVLDADWDVQLAGRPRLRASLTRARGDIDLQAETAEGTPLRVSAGIRQARLALEGDGPDLTLSLAWDSERAGSASGRLATRLSSSGDGWTWAADAPLDGRLQLQLPRMGVWSALAPPGWRVRGSVAADLAVGGRRDDPKLSGTLSADDLGLRSVVDGIALQDGRLRARLEDRRLRVDEVLMRGPSGGTVVATGEATWPETGGPRLDLIARLDRLRASVRPDREVTGSGTLAVGVDREALRLAGSLRIDRARIRIPDEAAPRLGEDVVVRNLPPGVSLGREPGAAGGRTLRVVVDVDLGDDFRVEGRGASGRLAGTINVAAESLAPPRLTGTLTVADGRYQAYGQRLEIERGVLRFTGPADNPALDLLAVRPHPVQKVGVQVTGRAQSPRVQLWAEPDLSEPEKLSWLVLGRPAPAGGAESAILGQAAVTLLAQRSGLGDGPGLARRFGLDELSLRRDGTQGAALTFGKRLADNLYASYERSLSGALGTLYVFYDLTRRLTLRAEAGDRSGVDLIYTLSFD